MSDIFREVDEDVRRDQLKKLWDRYGILMIVLGVLLVAGIGGWRGYEYWVSQKAARAGADFEAAAALSESGKDAEAEAAFVKIAGEAPSGYRALAGLRAAAETAQRDPKAAVVAYDKLSADRSLGIALQDLAGLRAAMLLLDSVPFDEMRRRLDVLAEPGRAFRHSARELLAISAWRHGDAAAAKRYIDMIAADGETPAGTRSRVEVLSALIAADGKG